MKVIVPLAGKGTRLLPVTREVPKPLIPVAGKTVLDHVMERLEGLDIEELLVITGHLKDRVEEYITSNYEIPARFIEQKTQDGTATAINLARPFVEGPVLVVFVDTVFDADLSIIDETDADGIIWAKEVEDYQRFGVIVTDTDGYMTRIVEKPSEPISRLANIGLYYIRDWKTLFEGIDWTLGRPPVKGEYFLTDAFQYMIDNGGRIKTAEVTGWYDCGKLDTLLDTNEHLLLHGHARQGDSVPDGVRLIDPVRISEGCVLSECTVGPNVTLGPNTRISGGEISEAIVGAGCSLTGSRVRRCLLGNGVTLDGGELEEMIVTTDERAPAP